MAKGDGPTTVQLNERKNAAEESRKTQQEGQPNRWEGKEEFGWEGNPSLTQGAGITVPESRPLPVGNGGEGEMRVNTEALTIAAENFVDMERPLRDARDLLLNQQVRAGGFYNAYQLQQQTTGAGSSSDAGSLKGRLLALLWEAAEAVVAGGKALRDTKDRYEKTEEQNSERATRLHEESPEFGDAEAHTNAISSNG